jgi:predicted ATPase
VIFLSSLVEAYMRLNRYDDALNVLGEALADAERTGDGHFLAELHRLQGVCLLELSPDNNAQAESLFVQALAISREQQAKALELRAATSIAGLWQQQGKRADAQHLLANVYGWFTEGFDTYDLRRAAELLRALT